MSRFGATGTFYYSAGTIGAGGTTINLSQSQMPQYPFEEYRISDKVEYRSIGGDHFSYQNYNKAGYVFRWLMLDEAATGSLRNMCTANPLVTFSSNGTLFGTFALKDEPTITETQFELYDVEINLEEK